MHGPVGTSKPPHGRGVGLCGSWLPPQGPAGVWPRAQGQGGCISSDRAPLNWQMLPPAGHARAASAPAAGTGKRLPAWPQQETRRCREQEARVGMWLISL